MNHQDAIAAVLTVGEGRGFVVKTDKQRLVITAAHCLPYFPRCASISQLEDRTYQALLGRIGEAPAVWAECLFADPIGDIAVLGPPDNQALSQEWDAYSALTGSTAPLIVADVPNEGTGWMLSLDGQWFKCDVRHEDGPLWIFDAAKDIEGGMSGSPIVDDKCSAIGVLCAAARTSGEKYTEGGPNPRLIYNLPGWLLQELH
jgi:hypothetical protein